MSLFVFMVKVLLLTDFCSVGIKLKFCRRINLERLILYYISVFLGFHDYFYQFKSNAIFDKYAVMVRFHFGEMSFCYILESMESGIRTLF